MAVKIVLFVSVLYMIPAWSQIESDSLNNSKLDTLSELEKPANNEVSFGVEGMPRPKGVVVYTELGHSNHMTSNFNNQGFSSTAKLRKTQSWVVKLRGPIINRDRIKLILGVKYKYQNFDFKNPDELTNIFHMNLEDKPINSIGMSFRMLNALKGNMSLLSRATFRLNGDFGKKDLKEHFKQSYTVLLAFKRGPEKAWGFGVSYSNSFGRPTVYPLLFFDYKFKPKWGIRSLLPVSIQLLYMPNEKNIISFNNKLEGDNYNLTFPTLVPSSLYLDNADFKSFFTYEREIYDFLWFDVSAGVRFNINFDIYDSDNFFDRSIPPGNVNNLVILNDLPPSAFFRVGLFLVPPRKWLE